MRHLSKISTVVLGFFCLGALTSCQLLDPKPKLTVDRPEAVVPQRFLNTDYEPLNEWLDTTIEVHLREVPLSQVFRSPELRPMNYRLINIGGDEPEVSIESVGMSRRQLLWSIAHEYSLEMTPVRKTGNESSYIEIRRRSRTGE